jgi:hypothetical protein
MAELSVTITRYLDDRPGYVACEFADADGEMRGFVANAAAVSAQLLSASSNYPRIGRIACRVEEEWGDQSGLDLARIAFDTADGDEESHVILSSDLR